MRGGIVFALFALSLASFAEGQTDVTAASSSTTYYFLIDASGSMSSKMGDAEDRVEALLDEIKVADSNARVSRTYFRADPERGDASCSMPVEIAPAVGAGESTAIAQVARGSTPLGAALDAALSQAGRGPARIYIVSDGSQTQSCGQNICTVASDRLPRPGVSVEFVPVGNVEAADSDQLGCIGAAQMALVQSAPQSSQSPRERAAPWWDWIARATWIGTLLFSAASAIAFGLRYSHQASALERKIKQGVVSADQSYPQNGRANEFEKPSLWGLGLVAVAGILFLQMWLCPLAYFSIAKGEALSNLDTEFGAAIFLASSLSLVGWSASQYWRFFEARREYYVATNRAEMEKRSRERRDKERLLDTYNRLRQTVQSYSYEADRKALRSHLELDESDTRADELVAELVRRAVGSEKQIDGITQNDIDAVSKFRSFLVRLSLRSLASTLKDTGAVRPETATILQSLLSSDPANGAEQRRKMLDQILSELRPA